MHQAQSYLTINNPRIVLASITKLLNFGVAQAAYSEVIQAVRSEMATLLQVAFQSQTAAEFAKNLKLPEISHLLSSSVPVIYNGLLFNVAAKIETASKHIRDNQIPEAFTLLRSISMTDVFGPMGSDDSFSTVIGLSISNYHQSPLIAAGQSIFDMYPAAMSYEQTVGVITAMLRTQSNNKAVLVGQFFSKNGDPFFGKFLQMVGEQSFMDPEIAAEYRRTVFSDVESLSNDYVEKAISATFPKDKFTVEMDKIKRLGAGTVAETFLMNVTVKKTGETLPVVHKIYRPNVNRRMAEGIERMRPLFYQSCDKYVNETVMNASYIPDDQKDLNANFMLKTMRDFYSVQSELNLQETVVTSERSFLEQARKIKGKIASAVSQLHLEGIVDHPQYPSVLMEFAAGKGLEVLVEEIRAGSVSKEEMAKIWNAINDVNVLFAKGALSGTLLHGDLNMANMAYQESGQIKLFDLGAALKFTNKAYKELLQFVAGIFLSNDGLIIEGLGGKLLSAEVRQEITALVSEVLDNGEWKKAVKNWENLSEEKRAGQSKPNAMLLKAGEITNKLNTVQSFRIPQAILEVITAASIGTRVAWSNPVGRWVMISSALAGVGGSVYALWPHIEKLIFQQKDKDVLSEKVEAN